MKHRETILVILAALCASLALADDFKTTNGKEYKNATVSRVEATRNQEFIANQFDRRRGC
jgi:hypothetical protein